MARRQTRDGGDSDGDSGTQREATTDTAKGGATARTIPGRTSVSAGLVADLRGAGDVSREPAASARDEALGAVVASLGDALAGTLGRSVDIKGSQTTRVDGTQDIQVSTVQLTEVGTAQVVLVGTSQTTEVGTDQVVVVERDQQVGIGRDQVVTIEGDRTLEVGGDQTVEVHKDLDLYVDGDHEEECEKDRTLTVGKKLTIDVHDELVLQCGAARLTLKKDGEVTIEGVRVKLRGETWVKVEGPTRSESF